MSADVFRAALDRKRSAVMSCYDNALATNHTLEGDLTLLITINQQGGVSIRVEQSDPVLLSAGVTECVVGALRGINFSSSPPQGGDFSILLPLSFRVGD